MRSYRESDFTLFRTVSLFIWWVSLLLIVIMVYSGRHAGDDIAKLRRDMLASFTDPHICVPVIIAVWLYLFIYSQFRKHDYTQQILSEQQATMNTMLRLFEDTEAERQKLAVEIAEIRRRLEDGVPRNP